MERSKFQCNQLPAWCTVATGLVLSLYVSCSAWMHYHPIQPNHNVNWQPLNTTVTKNIVTNNKCALLFITDGGLSSARMQQTLEKPELARFINDRYVPLMIHDRRTAKDRYPKEVAHFIMDSQLTGSPGILVVPPDEWDTEADGYSNPETAQYANARAIEELIRESVDFRTECNSHKSVHWNSPELALQKSSKEKPALLIFVRARDAHSREVKYRLFEEDKVLNEVNSNFLPALVVDQSRTGANNSPESKALIAKHHIKNFPTVVVCQPGKEPHVMVDYAGSAQTLDFLQRTRSAI